MPTTWSNGKIHQIKLVKEGFFKIPLTVLDVNMDIVTVPEAKKITFININESLQTFWENNSIWI